MNGVDILRRLMIRASGGFAIALHEIAPLRLAEFVDTMSPARVIPLAEIVKRRKAGMSTAGLFAITVDDGVGHNIRLLAQLCHSRGWPVTFYLPTQYVDTGE